MAGKYELKKTAKGQFHFVLKASNGQVILSSQMYKTKGGAEGGVESVRKNSPNDARYERKTSSKGEPYFTLKAANGEPIGNSEMYSSAAAMEKGVASVKANGPGAKLDDLTA